MVQQFIVEGNDGYVLSALGTKHGLGYPVGYNKNSYKEFIVKAGGIDNVSIAITDALDNEDVSNIGVVIDANDVGVASRVARVTAAIRSAYSDVDFTIEPTEQGWVKELKPGLTFGLWVMPDNVSPGYLEHFLARLIAEDSPDLALAKDFLTQTKATGNPQFPAIKDQKALLALYLAIQSQPGMNPQTAIRKGLLSHQKPLAQNFLTWFTNTFQF